MANLSDGFQQVKLDDKGTYGAYNPTTSQAVAFPDQNTLNSFFGPNTAFDPNATMANFNTSGLLGSNAGKVQSITMNSLSPATPLTVPTATPTADSLAPATAAADQTTKTLEQYIKEATPAATETSKQYDQLLSQINTLLPSTTGRGAAQASAEASAGLPDMKKQLADLNARILTKVASSKAQSASYDQLIANLENPNNQQQLGIPMSAIIGQQAQVRKMQLAENNSNSADLGVLQAFALGLQGQVTAAQDGINRAVDLKFQDAQDTLNLKLKQLDLLAGKLNKEEVIQAEALKRQYADQQQQIADDKEKAKNNLNLAVQNKVNTRFANNKGEFFDTLSGVPYKDPNAFFKAAGVKSFEEAYAKGLVTDISQLSSIDLKQYPASYQEYLLAKQDGYKGGYNDYQTMDANRKAVRSTTINNNGDYRQTTEEKAIADFRSKAADFITKLDSNQVTWGAAWNALHSQFPEASVDTIDNALNAASYRNSAHGG